MKLLRSSLLAALLALSLSACASTPGGEEPPALGYDEINDPLEPINRTTFEINLLLDAVLIRPIAEPYHELMPVFVQDILRNVIRTLDTPRNLANALLQGNVDALENIAARFLINTTLGVGGLFDIAADSGYPYQSEDFGQTLGVWGLEPGFYLVLPVFGPSSARDAFGMGVDIFLDPMTYYGDVDEVTWASRSKLVVGGIDLRSRNIDTLDDLRRDSVDFYARMRSLWYQNRLSEIHGSESPAMEVPDFSDELFEEESEEEPGGQEPIGQEHSGREPPAGPQPAAAAQ